MKKQIILAAAALMISAGVMAQTTPQTKNAPVKQATTQTTSSQASPVAQAKAPEKSSAKKSPVSKKKTAPMVKKTEVKNEVKK
ncbi:MAG TPA: hypothetical protein PKH02_02450 [Bacteroidales bacterium]|nr:hypothetical protein [Bacteroidales bacterium]